MNMLIKKKILQNLIKQELKNIAIKILDHSDPTLVNLEGTLLSETKNMLKVQVDGKIIDVAKASGTFGILFEGKNLIISGEILVGSLKQRSKKKYKNW